MPARLLLIVSTKPLATTHRFCSHTLRRLVASMLLAMAHSACMEEIRQGDRPDSTSTHSLPALRARGATMAAAATMAFATQRNKPTQESAGTLRGPREEPTRPLPEKPTGRKVLIWG